MHYTVHEVELGFESFLTQASIQLVCKTGSGPYVWSSQ